MHKCFTSDGMAIGCLCVRGEDHDEDYFDIPVGDASDRFTEIDQQMLDEGGA